MIRAAGAVLWRENSDLFVEIALVHRSRYNDWTLPKGKIEDGESAITCALREVREETGITGRFTRQLKTVEYEDAGQKKRVKFWAAHCALDKSEFVPNDEVDQLKWLSAAQAIELATYPSDRDVIQEFIDGDQHTDTLIILRHAKALERGDWDGDDSLRTLSELGVKQAEFLIEHLRAFSIDEIYTSNYTRCVQTITPLASERKLSFTQVPNLNEENFEFDPERSISFANALKQDEKNILICSHNPVIPTMLRGILNTKLKSKELIKLEPGDAWVVHRVRGEIVGIDYLSISN